MIFDARFELQKEDIMRKLKENGIDSLPFFYPLSSQSAYEHTIQEKKAQEKITVSYSMSSRGINLPCGMNMDQETVAHVCHIGKQVLGIE